ncbi:MAG TPA: response regulator, partial [Gemmataceae bacterium]|nr:response regulator [Gemmataceae bacterium]
MTAARPLLLLVDDAPEMGLLVRRLGRQAGYDLLACEDAGAAWRHLENTTAAPDLVLLDLHL